MGSPPTLDEPDPNRLPQPSLFTCSDPQAPRSSPARLRRLITPEWTRAFGRGHSEALGNNPYKPDANARYSTHRQQLTTDAPTLDQMLAFEAELPLDRWNIEVTCIFDEGKMPSDTCISESIATILERRVYFRPPTPSQQARIEAFARANFTKDLAGTQTRKESIQQILKGAWLTTGAMFRTEFGEEPDASGRYKLSDWELAHALTYAITDRAPGSPERAVPRGLTPIDVYTEVKQAALDGNVSDREFIAAFVRDNLFGDDPGTLDPMGDPEALPPEIAMMPSGQERNDAIIAWTGREDLLLDFNQAKHRNRRSRYWMSEKLRRFFREWLDYADLISVFKDHPEATSRFDSPERDKRKIKTAYEFLSGEQGFSDYPFLDEQLDETIARVMVGDTQVLKNLMTTRDFFTRTSAHTNTGYFIEQIGYIYDIDTLDDANTIPDTRAGVWQKMPDNQRAGVLTHPAWLAAHGGNFDNDPSAVHRGKWIRENLLCESIPDIPLGVEAQLDPNSTDLPARHRISAATDEDPYCAGCHSFMNPLGYPFEIYNHAGYVRADDHGFAPDGSASLLRMPTADDVLREGMQVRDAVEMMELFGESRHVKRCFIRHTFRFFMGRDETTADACTLAEMEQSYDQSNGSFKEMLVTLLTSDTFFYRTRLTTEPNP